METQDKFSPEWSEKRKPEVTVLEKSPQYEQPVAMPALTLPTFSTDPQRVFAAPGKKYPLIIAIANQKGGVAKTTTTVSLGGALVGFQKEVLLVDLDAQANLTLALGKNPAQVRQSITDVLFHSASLLSASQETDYPGLDLIPSNSGMEVAERFLPVRKDYEMTLKQVMSIDLNRQESARNRNNVSKECGFSTSGYDYVLLDCPPNMGAVTLNALVAADLLIIPTQAEFFAAHALRTMISGIHQVKAKLNPHLTYRVLITMLDKRNRIHRQIKEQVAKTFADGIFETVIEVDTKLRESAVEGKPIMFFNAMTRSALQYAALAQEILQYGQ